MKISSRLFRHHRRPGYTLVELTIAIMVGLAMCAMLMTLANQQFLFMKIFRAQNFLVEEAPVINTHLARLIGRADRFRLHRNVTDALTGANPVLEDGTVVALVFKQPDGAERTSLLSWETRGGVAGLYYYNVPLVGALGEPGWVLTKRPREVAFSISQGILRTTLTGPAGEVITYSGTMQQ